MIKCECIEKFRDKQGNIKGYRLRDCNGACLDVKPDQLKMSIFSQQLDVINLKLTADGKLIDKEVDIITKLEQIDAYNQTEKAINDRWNKYLKLVAHFNKRVYQLNEKFNLKNEQVDTFNGIRIYKPGVNLDGTEIYSRKTSIKIHEPYNVHYEVRLFHSDYIDLLIPIYTREPSEDGGAYSAYMMYNDSTDNGYKASFEAFYKATPEYIKDCGDDDIDTIRKERQDLVARVICAEVLDNYQEIMKLTEKALVEAYKKKCKY